MSIFSATFGGNILFTPKGSKCSIIPFLIKRLKSACVLGVFVSCLVSFYEFPERNRLKVILVTRKVTDLPLPWIMGEIH